MSWIHYQDYINALDYLLTEKSLFSAINVVAPQAVTNSLFTQVLADSMHRLAIFPVPRKIMQYLLGESSCLLLDSQRVVPQALLISGFEFSFPSLKSALIDVLKDLPNKES